MIHIALSVYDPKGTYSRHAGVVMASILRNTEQPVCFHILHDETLTDENRRRLEETFTENARNANSVLCFTEMYPYVKRYSEEDLDRFGGGFTRGALYRLCLPEALSDVDELIYLDCDIVVNLDIAELWNERMHAGAFDKYILAGVREYTSLAEPECFTPRAEIKTNKYGVSDDRYINSGVLLMHIGRIRAEYAEKGSLIERAIAYIAKYAPPYPDQDFLNAEYIDATIYVDQKYNDVPIEDYEDVYNVKRIWHFFAKGKPWNLIRGSNADMLYWKNLTYTPWRDELIESFYNAAAHGEFYHRHSRDCICRLLAQMKNNVKNIGRIFKK